MSAASKEVISEAIGKAVASQSQLQVGAMRYNPRVRAKVIVIVKVILIENE